MLQLGFFKRKRPEEAEDVDFMVSANFEKVRLSDDLWSKWSQAVDSWHFPSWEKNWWSNIDGSIQTGPIGKSTQDRPLMVECEVKKCQFISRTLWLMDKSLWFQFPANMWAIGHGDYLRGRARASWTIGLGGLLNRDWAASELCTLRNLHFPHSSNTVWCAAVPTRLLQTSNIAQVDERVHSAIPSEDISGMYSSTVHFWAKPALTSMKGGVYV